MNAVIAFVNWLAAPAGLALVLVLVLGFAGPESYE